MKGSPDVSSGLPCPQLPRLPSLSPRAVFFHLSQRHPLPPKSSLLLLGYRTPIPTSWPPWGGGAFAQPSPHPHTQPFGGVPCALSWLGTDGALTPFRPGSEHRAVAATVTRQRWLPELVGSAKTGEPTLDAGEVREGPGSGGLSGQSLGHGAPPVDPSGCTASEDRKVGEQGQGHFCDLRLLQANWRETQWEKERIVLHLLGRSMSRDCLSTRLFSGFLRGPLALVRKQQHSRGARLPQLSPSGLVPSRPRARCQWCALRP